jgi:8-oxo-dGTP diphosphatase
VWVASKHLNQYEFPAANRPIISAINLPNRILITGSFDSIQEYDSRLDSALKHGIRMVQLRIQDHASLTHLAPRALDICQRYSAHLLINTNPTAFKENFANDQLGLHLNSKNLLNCDSRPVAENVLLGASCHNEHEISHAQNIGVDFICLSPVLTTQSHPGEPEMGWEKFEELVMVAKVPVFALGGMKELHLPLALQNGAQGIAAISEWWK